MPDLCVVAAAEHSSHKQQREAQYTVCQELYPSSRDWKINAMPKSAAKPSSASSLYAGPTAAECVAVCDALAAQHGRPRDQRQAPREGCEIQEPHTVLDSLVRTILSQNTTDKTSQRAFSSLKAAFPDWELVRTAAPGAVEEAIRVGGLADIKAARIKAILNTLLEQTGTLSLEHLRSLPCEDVRAHLSQFKGVGPKTIACVLLFCLGRAEFPVDTHVWEISKQLGWVPANATREQTFEHLNGRVPDDIKYDLHVLMVQHGKVCAACSKRGTAAQHMAAAEVQPCPLTEFKRRKRSPKLKAGFADEVKLQELQVSKLSSMSDTLNAAAAATAVHKHSKKRVQHEVLQDVQAAGDPHTRAAIAVKLETDVHVTAATATAEAAVSQLAMATDRAVKAEDAAALTSGASTSQPVQDLPRTRQRLRLSRPS